MGLVRTVGPSVEPIDAAAVSAHVRIDTDDPVMNTLIAASRGWVEARLQRALTTQTWVLTLDAFPLACRAEYQSEYRWRTHDGHRYIRLGEIRLPWPNLLAVSSVQYVDTNGNTQTLSSSNYIVDTGNLPGSIVPSYGTWWPSTRYQPNAVTITYTAGFGPVASDVPVEIKQAMLLVCGDLYRNREAQAISSGVTIAENPAVNALLSRYIVREAV